MRKLIERPRLLAVLLLAVYVLGLVLGGLTLSLYPLARQKRILTNRAHEIAQEYPAGDDDRIQRTKSAFTHVLIYNAEKRCVLYATQDEQHGAGDFYDYLAPFMPEVFAGDDVFRLTRSYFSTKLTHLWLVAGAPLREQGRVTGAVFVIDSLVNLQEAFIGYVLCFTFFYWLTAYFFIVTAQKQKKVDELKQNYIANMTHALKTPIASIKVLTETLSDSDVGETDPEKRRAYYGMILREVNMQARMVQEMLELSRLQSNGVDLSKAPVDVGPVFERVRERYSAMCDYADITLNISERALNLPPLYTNEACLRQVLELLIDNALKFVAEGGIIEVDASDAGNHAVFRVWDNGDVIAKADLPNVFERFYKGSNERNENGSGLGLAIAKEIMDGLKEKIWVESESGKGTAFYFTVRLK